MGEQKDLQFSTKAQDLEDEDFEMDEENEELLLQKLEEIGDSGRTKHKTFEGIPKQWHQTIRVKNPET